MQTWAPAWRMRMPHLFTAGWWSTLEVADRRSRSEHGRQEGRYRNGDAGAGRKGGSDSPSASSLAAKHAAVASGLKDKVRYSLSRHNCIDLPKQLKLLAAEVWGHKMLLFRADMSLLSGVSQPELVRVKSNLTSSITSETELAFR